MSVGKYFTNKAKTKSKWWFVTRVKTGEFDRFGNPITRQIRKKGFATREKAKEAERKFLNDYDNNKVETNKDLTLGDISQLFFDYIENEGQYAKSTIYNYRVYYNKYIKEPLGNIPISKLSFDIVQKFFRKLYNGVSVHVYNHCLKFVKRAFNYAIEIDKIAVNPFTKIKPLRCEDKVRNRFSVEDMKILSEATGMMNTSMEEMAVGARKINETGVTLNEISDQVKDAISRIGSQVDLFKV